MSQVNGAVPSPRMNLACLRCRQRKTKCDRLIPRCSSCVKLGVECLSSQQLSASSDQNVARGFLEDLEREVQALEVEASRISDGSAIVPSSITPGPSTGSHPTAGSIAGSAFTDESTTTIQPSDEASHGWSSLSEARPGTSDDHRTYLFVRMVKLALLTGNGDPHCSGGTNPVKESLYPPGPHKHHDMFCKEHRASEVYLNHYFECIQPALPFLNEEEVRHTFKILPSDRPPDPPRRLILYMVLAIGACLPTTSGFYDAYQSTRFFIYALKCFDGFIHDENMETVRILTLFTLHSLLHSGGGSSWHLRGLTMRLCITLGLHHESSLRGNGRFSSEEISLRRTTFWSIYVLDRWICLALDRPYGIQNLDISTELPKETSYTEPSPEFLFHWAYKTSDFKTSGGNLSPVDFGELLKMQEHMRANQPPNLDSSKLLFRVYILQNITWLVCLPHLSMDTSGIELATSITNEYISLLDYLQSSNYILPWPVAYGVLHTIITQLFIHSLVQPGRNDQRPWPLLNGLATTIRILHGLTSRFPGLTKKVELVKSLEKAVFAAPTDDASSKINVDFAVGSHTYYLLKSVLALQNIPLGP